MGRPKFDPSKIHFVGDIAYYGERRATRWQITQWKKSQPGYSSNRPQVTSDNQKFFGGKKLTGSTGHVQKPFRPMTLKGGKNPIYNWDKKTGWGSSVNPMKVAAVLKGFKEWVTHLRDVAHRLGVNAKNFRIMLAYRAQTVFQNSFKIRRFYTSSSQRWRDLATYTKKKRLQRQPGKPLRVLYEFGDLEASIKIKEDVGGKSRVYTDEVQAAEKKYKKHTLCYAGYHNEGFGNYGRTKGGKLRRPYIQRQFMGHSSHLDPYRDHFIGRMVTRYLFDDVWQVRR